jgi:hypothetical protein
MLDSRVLRCSIAWRVTTPVQGRAIHTNAPPQIHTSSNGQLAIQQAVIHAS